MHVLCATNAASVSEDEGLHVHVHARNQRPALLPQDMNQTDAQVHVQPTVSQVGGAAAEIADVGVERKSCQLDRFREREIRVQHARKLFRRHLGANRQGNLHDQLAALPADDTSANDLVGVLLAAQAHETDRVLSDDGTRQSGKRHRDTLQVRARGFCFRSIQPDAGNLWISEDNPACKQMPPMNVQFDYHVRHKRSARWHTPRARGVRSGKLVVRRAQHIVSSKTAFLGSGVDEQAIANDVSCCVDILDVRAQMLVHVNPALRSFDDVLAERRTTSQEK